MLTRLGLLLLFLAATGACAARPGVPKPFPGAAVPPTASEPPAEVPDPRPAPPVPPAPVVEARPDVRETPPPGDPPVSIVQTALALQGVPYVYGGTDLSGFDCSGFVQYVFARHGLALPREVRDQYLVGRRIALNDIRPGDLLFFETVTRGASHVGIAIGDGRFVHAPNSKGVVRVEPYTAIYWSRRLIGVRRLAGDDPPTPTGFPGSVRSAR